MYCSLTKGSQWLPKSPLFHCWGASEGAPAVTGAASEIIKEYDCPKTHWQNRADHTSGHNRDVSKSAPSSAITMNLSALELGNQAKKHETVKISTSKCQTPTVLLCKRWGQWLFEEFISWYQQQPFSFACPEFLWSSKPQNATGCKSNWRVKRCLGFELNVGCRQCMCRCACSCVFKSMRVCLWTCVSFGSSSNVWGSWANGRTLHPTSPCYCVGMREQYPGPGWQIKQRH